MTGPVLFPSAHGPQHGDAAPRGNALSCCFGCRIVCGVDGQRGAGRVIRPGAITVLDAADGQVLHLSGDVDAVVVRDAEADCPLDLSRVMAVDVGELAYIDSTGLTLLVRWAQKAAAAGRPAEIRRSTPRFDRVLEVAGLRPFFVQT